MFWLQKNYAKKICPLLFKIVFYKLHVKICPCSQDIDKLLFFFCTTCMFNIPALKSVYALMRPHFHQLIGRCTLLLHFQSGNCCILCLLRYSSVLWSHCKNKNKKQNVTGRQLLRSFNALLFHFTSLGTALMALISETVTSSIEF